MSQFQSKMSVFPLSDWEVQDPLEQEWYSSSDVTPKLVACNFLSKYNLLLGYIRNPDSMDCPHVSLEM